MVCFVSIVTNFFSSFLDYIYSRFSNNRCYNDPENQRVSKIYIKWGKKTIHGKWKRMICILMYETVCIYFVLRINGFNASHLNILFVCDSFSIDFCWFEDVLLYTRHVLFSVIIETLEVCVLCMHFEVLQRVVKCIKHWAHIVHIPLSQQNWIWFWRWKRKNRIGIWSVEFFVFIFQLFFPLLFDNAVQ